MFRSLSDLSELNPNFQCASAIEPSDLVSFIPMGDVSDSGHWMRKRTKPLKSVRQGFTPFANGDVLFAKITPCMENGKGAHVLGLTNGVGFGSTEFHVLRPKPEADARFIFHHTQHRALRSAAEAAMTGSAGQKRVPTEFFHKWKVYAPGKAEQSRIADILDTLDTQIQKTEALIAKLEKIKEGLLHDLLTRGIDQNGQLRPTPDQAPELYKESALGLIPKEWEVLSAEEVCEAVIDCKNRTPPEKTTGFPVIRTPNVRNGRFVYSDLLFTDRKSYEIWTQRGAPRPGDIVITREAPVGEVCKIPTSMKQACLGQRMMMYQPDPSIILTDYMLAALVSRRVQNRLLDLAGGSTVGHVKVGDIRQLAIPTPPVSEQTLIAESFNSIESRLRNEAHELEKLRLEKTGLMDDLLTGRVRVTPLLKDAV